MFCAHLGLLDRSTTSCGTHCLHFDTHRSSQLVERYREDGLSVNVARVSVSHLHAGALSHHNLHRQYFKMTNPLCASAYQTIDKAMWRPAASITAAKGPSQQSLQLMGLLNGLRAPSPCLSLQLSMRLTAYQLNLFALWHPSAMLRDDLEVAALSPVNTRSRLRIRGFLLRGLCPPRRFTHASFPAFPASLLGWLVHFISQSLCRFARHL